MSLRSFLFACETLREQQTQDGFHVETEREPTPADMRERNAQAMSMIQGMMAGVQRKR